MRAAFESWQHTTTAREAASTCDANATSMAAVRSFVGSRRNTGAMGSPEPDRTTGASTCDVRGCRRAEHLDPGMFPMARRLGEPVQL